MKLVFAKLLCLLSAVLLVLPFLGALPRAVAVAEGASGGAEVWDIFEMYIPREWDQDYDVIFTWQYELPTLPETVIAVVDKSTEDEYISEDIPIGVSWVLDGFDCGTVGSYELTAAAPQSELDRLGLTNTKGCTAYMLVSVQKKGPIDSLHGKFITDEGDAEHSIKLYLPVLPEDATAVYLYTKAPNATWTRVLNPDGEENFLDLVWGPSIEYPGTEQDFRYDYTPTKPEPITLQMEVEGSANAGFTNELTLFPPGYVPPPGDSTEDDSDDSDDGSSGGDRGGGGQGEETRKLPPPAPTPMPLPIKATPAPTAAPAPEPTPEPDAPPSGGSSVQAQEAMGGGTPVDDVPPHREEPRGTAPVAAAAAALTVGAAGAAGAGYTIFIRKRP